MLACSVLALLPDIDVITFRLGIPYGAPLGHRGMTHSLAFALLVGLAAAVFLRLRGRPWVRDAVLVTLVVASHGLLDACTTGGKGVEFFWPVDAAVLPALAIHPRRADRRPDAERTRSRGAADRSRALPSRVDLRLVAPAGDIRRPLNARGAGTP